MCFRRNHPNSPFHRYRKGLFLCSCHLHRPETHPGKEVHQWKAEVSLCAPYSSVCSFWRNLSSRKFVCLCRNIDQPDTWWLEDPKREFVSNGAVKMTSGTYRWSTLNDITAVVTFTGYQTEPFACIFILAQLSFEAVFLFRGGGFLLSFYSCRLCWKIAVRDLFVVAQ